jgi:hypothetical protein
LALVPDHRPLAAIGLSHCRRHLADVTNAAWINCCSYRRRNAPSDRNTTGCPSRALAALLVEEGAIVSTIVLVVIFCP